MNGIIGYQCKVNAKVNNINDSGNFMKNTSEMRTEKKTINESSFHAPIKE
jgi:hypothetical protein